MRPPGSTSATSVGTFRSKSGAFFVRLTRSSQALVAASPRAAAVAFESASIVAGSFATAASHRSARSPSSCTHPAAPLTSPCAPAVSSSLLLVAALTDERTSKNDSKPTTATIRALTAMILIRIGPRILPASGDVRAWLSASVYQPRPRRVSLPAIKTLPFAQRARQHARGLSHVEGRDTTKRRRPASGGAPAGHAGHAGMPQP